MATLNEIIQSDDYEQYELKEVYQATQMLLQEFQKSKNEPEKLKELIIHLRKRLDGQAAYPLAVLLECSQLAIRHQLQEDWNSPMKQRQLFLYESLFSQFRGKIPATLWNQVCLNYAEALIYIGRSLDGLQILEEMIETENDPSYERKDGERGWGLLYYSTFIKDKEEKAEALHIARNLLQQVENEVTDVNGRALYSERLKLAENMIGKLGVANAGEGYKPNFFDGREKEYRDWCAEHRLLLNSGNEIDPEGTMKLDMLRYRHTGDDKEHGLFLETYMDSLISEFTAIRWNLFEALDSNSELPHRNEQLKNVYRQSFLMFDKIGLFLNYYYKLEVKETRTSLQRIWFEEEHPKKPLKPFIQNSANGALKSLYWLSKELFGYERSDQQSLAMVRSQLLRHNMERNFVQVIDSKEEIANESELRKHQMTQKELERMALNLSVKARNALMYLGFAMDLEKK